MDELIQIYKALADKNRIRILNLLELKPFCVCELADILGLAQSSTSEHLKVLKDAGLIEDRKDSYWVNYCLAKDTKDKLVKDELRILAKSFKNDPVIKEDRKRARRVKRENLCK